MYTQEQISILRLIRTEQIGPITFHKLIKKYGSASAALENWAFEPLANKVKLCPLEDVQGEIASTHEKGFTFSFYIDDHYPQSLKESVSPPPVLTIKGGLSLSHRPCVAIVGARNASYGGKQLAHQIAQELGQAGIVVVSGLARGIDAAAHRGALTTGTIGVLAGGLNIIYPEENTKLYQDMGLVISDMPLGAVPQAHHFPKRNRLIAALSQAVVVIEAAFQSGSLLTAGFAADEGRDVYVVPGSPMDPRCRGSNGLIKKGATLVESARDIIELLNPQLPQFHKSFKRMKTEKSCVADKLQIGNNTQDKILTALNHVPTPGDEILQTCNMPAMTFWSMVSDLEMQGKLIRYAGNLLALK